ncbi:rho family [Zalerion maritima]|uniref:Rho family n=1 Tax=Zalerion maritima TaxID=339359 RepID=A0AAD5S0E2_9PEZI|nr:rho family [Zalerion maritima]
MPPYEFHGARPGSAHSSSASDHYSASLGEEQVRNFKYSFMNMEETPRMRFAGDMNLGVDMRGLSAEASMADISDVDMGTMSLAALAETLPPPTPSEPSTAKGKVSKWVQNLHSPSTVAEDFEALDIAIEEKRQKQQSKLATKKAFFPVPATASAEGEDDCDSEASLIPRKKARLSFHGFKAHFGQRLASRRLSKQLQKQQQTHQQQQEAESFHPLAGTSHAGGIQQGTVADDEVLQYQYPHTEVQKQYQAFIAQDINQHSHLHDGPEIYQPTLHSQQQQVQAQATAVPPPAHVNTYATKVLPALPGIPHAGAQDTSHFDSQAQGQAHIRLNEPEPQLRPHPHPHPLRSHPIHGQARPVSQLPEQIRHQQALRVASASRPGSVPSPSGVGVDLTRLPPEHHRQVQVQIPQGHQPKHVHFQQPQSQFKHQHSAPAQHSPQPLPKTPVSQIYHTEHYLYAGFPSGGTMSGSPSLAPAAIPGAGGGGAARPTTTTATPNPQQQHPQHPHEHGADRDAGTGVRNIARMKTKLAAAAANARDNLKFNLPSFRLSGLKTRTFQEEKEQAQRIFGGPLLPEQERVRAGGFRASVAPAGPPQTRGKGRYQYQTHVGAYVPRHARHHGRESTARARGSSAEAGHGSADVAAAAAAAADADEGKSSGRFKRPFSVAFQKVSERLVGRRVTEHETFPHSAVLGSQVPALAGVGPGQAPGGRGRAGGPGDGESASGSENGGGVRVVVLGESGCGKSAMVQKALRSWGPERWYQHSPTHLDFYARVLDVSGVAVQLSAWDTSGTMDPEFAVKSVKNVNPHAILVCIGIESRGGLLPVFTKYVPLARKHFPRVPIWLVGTKADLRANPLHMFRTRKNNISEEEKEMYGENNPNALTINEATNAAATLSLEGSYIECSAVRADNSPEEIFRTAALYVLRQRTNVQMKKIEREVKRKERKSSGLLFMEY